MDDKVTDALIQAGRWRVVINGGDSLGETRILYCVNRPAISYGERMIRIADAEFEVWLQHDEVLNLEVDLIPKKTMLQLVEQYGVDKIRETAKALRVDESDDNSLMVSQILFSAAEMYEGVAEFVIPEGDAGG